MARERAAERVYELIRLELQARSENTRTLPRVAEVRAKFPKLPPFIDNKDDLDSYLERFERLGTTNNWPPEDRITHLSALLTGRAF